MGISKFPDHTYRYPRTRRLKTYARYEAKELHVKSAKDDGRNPKWPHVGFR